MVHKDIRDIRDIKVKIPRVFFAIFLGLMGIEIILAAYVRKARAAEIHVPTPHVSIQSAINVAVGGDEIIVDMGIYREGINFNGKAITVRSINPNDPGTVAATIIDATGIDATGIDATGSGHVVEFTNEEESNCVLAGFTVKGGKGGIYCQGASPTITHCTISYNKADHYGGGIYCANASPSITYCTINYNWAKQNDGGGIYANADSSPRITNCTICNNTSYGDGGGIYGSSSSMVIDNCTINFNKANYGGGICSKGSLTTNHCIVNNNSSYDEGGGIYCLNALTINDCTINDNASYLDGGGIYCGDLSTITNCNLIGNLANRYGGGIYGRGKLDISECVLKTNMSYLDGGGLYCGDLSTVSDCTMSDNSSYGQGGGIYAGDSTSITGCSVTGNMANEGGGVYGYGLLNITESNFGDNRSYGEGGGIYCGDSSVITLSSISDNLAGLGGGIYTEGELTINNSVLNNNSSSNEGGAICIDGLLIMTNCTITGNFAYRGGGIFGNGIFSSSTITNCILWGDSPDEICFEGSAPLVTYCDIQGDYNGTENNIKAFPDFVDADTGNYRLKAGSLCINAGTGDEAPEIDKDGHLRDYVSDIGAYEYENHAPILEAIGHKEVLPGKVLQFSLSAKDPDNDLLTYSVNYLPPGASFNPDTLVFSWRPDHKQAGTYNEIFTVTDIGTPPLSDSESLIIKVKTANNNSGYLKWFSPFGYQNWTPLPYNQSQLGNLFMQPFFSFQQFQPIFNQNLNQQQYQPLAFNNYQQSLWAIQSQLWNSKSPAFTYTGK